MAIAKYFEISPFAILLVTGRSAYERFWVFWSFWKKTFWGARRIGIGVLAQ